MPLVSVVTPVYNGERYLAECIESILEQSFPDFEYIIVDNCSSDRTRQIAERYTSDPRVRIHSNTVFVPAIANYNRGARLVSRGARYLQFVASDDRLLRDCLKEMVALAEAHPSVKLVASYKVHGRRTICSGPPFPQAVMRGKDVCRAFFEGNRDLLGGPTNHLIRLPVESSDGPMFDEEFIHSDTDLFIRILKGDADYGFVHQVLTFSREHEHTLSSSVSDVLGTRASDTLAMLIRHGAAFLLPAEYRALIRSHRRSYARWLFRVLLKPWDRRGWSYQAERRRQLGLGLTWFDFVDGAIRESVSSVAKPRETWRRIRRDYSRVAASRT
jgi:glycosyltransferase involved in cell wall biosynthesis